MARTEARDPVLNAVTPRFYDHAKAQIAKGLPDGPLKGVPYLLKDLGVYYAGFPTTNASRLFADVRSVMGEMGKAMMGTGEASGGKRAITGAGKRVGSAIARAPVRREPDKAGEGGLPPGGRPRRAPAGRTQLPAP